MINSGRWIGTSILVGSVGVLAILLGGCGPTTEAPVTSSAAQNTELDSKPPPDTLTATRRTYIETFDDGPGGWYGGRKFELPVWDGVAYCFGPWWTDANHAPPGAGYLHMLLWAYTVKKHYQVDSAYNRALPYRHSRFAEEGYSTNLTNAKLTVRLRGHGDFKEAELLLLVQAQTDKTTVNSALTGQPFKITPEWSEQTVHLGLSWVEIKSTAVKVDRCFEVLAVSVAADTSLDRHDLAVEAFSNGIGDPMCAVADDVG